MASTELHSFSILAWVRRNLPRFGTTALADEVIADTTNRRIIRTPFYYQFDYPWCWAASSSMVFRALNQAIQPQELL